MSLLGRVPDTVLQIKTLQSLLNPQYGPELSAFLVDAIRFIRADIVTMGSFPLQIYSSLLVFAPKDSIIRTTFENQIAHWISLKPQVATSWVGHVQTLSSNGRFVAAVVSSPDSSLLASSGGRIIRLWRTDTYECNLTLEGHYLDGSTLKFSHDSSMLASGSMAKAIKIWRPDIGDCIQTFKGHYRGVLAAAFPYDPSKLVASASKDGSIRIWRATTGECIKVLDGHSDSAISVSFSHDSTFLVSCSVDKNVRIWRMSTWECLKTFQTANEAPLHACLSPDSTLLATAQSKCILIWSVASGELLTIIPEGHICFRTTLKDILERHQIFRQVAFSHDSERISSGISGRSIRV